jgi:hypothetical protein
MRQGNMLIYHRRRLSAAVATCDAEIMGGHLMLAEGTLERCATIHRFGRVISHRFQL